ncbi:MAG: shikimate dehydrogenase family protein [Flavobacterium sp.]
MEQKQKEINWFGLLGRNIEYSFSRTYFADKFEKQQLHQCRYVNFDVQDIDQLYSIFEQYPNLKGFNVTIPYKQAIIPFLNKIADNAKEIGAVNCVKVTPQGLEGHNTDAFGFQTATEKILQPHHKKALILGTGGASKAVKYALKKMGIAFQLVSRKPQDGEFRYEDLNQSIFNEFQIIINTTPLGTYPNIEECPPISYSFFNEYHLAMDLIYNPKKTLFLKSAEANGATILNGLDMLIHQAEKSWELWNR